MGGTEIAAALRAAYRITGEPGIAGEPGMDRDLLLITDGEVWDTKQPVAEARRSGYRIFTVGVGSAVAEAFVRELAAATGGACELVAPRQDAMKVAKLRKLSIPWSPGVMTPARSR